MIALYVISFVFIISPFFPAIRNPHWFFRTADFIRLQSIFIEIICLILLFVLEDNFTTEFWVFVTGLSFGVVYQAIKVYPYSSFYPRKKPNFPSDGMVSILAANVLQSNNDYRKFIALIEKFDPDLVLTMESNKDWEQNLKEIESIYSHSVKIPKENFYGMHLYSKKALLNVSVNYNVEEDVPSIFCEYTLNNSLTVFLACLHPAPPSPTENETSKERDAELMIVGNHIREIEKPVVVCGDMNDVVWSRTTRLFKKMTGMIDPRIGRGFFPTYHANYFWMRFPLDHLFHTKDLFIGKMVRTSNFGSDHFGMYYEIHHKKKALNPSNPKLNNGEEQEIDDIIEEAEY